MPKSHSVMGCLVDILSPGTGQDGGKSSRPGDEGVGLDKWWEINQMDACSPTILKLLSVRYEFMKNDSVVVFRLHLESKRKNRACHYSNELGLFHAFLPTVYGFMVRLHLRFVETIATAIVWTFAILLYWVNTNCNHRTYFWNYSYSLYKKTAIIHVHAITIAKSSTNRRYKWTLKMYNFEPLNQL